ncbi:DUF4442 domain-containing protein [Alteromonas oceanisediminis]|uniref:DUF4442 domain-containing protein n=1 Tax=Alteromonas oceanisediminis TaxID=2836180 RepID=UPI001BDA3977|nr:DUF4442 domain-containing protein [Alteromonas oceanisediminis]MBT0586050.1 PaaI family thioesterase [Alteromonas oceanisediminis]
MTSPNAVRNPLRDFAVKVNQYPNWLSSKLLTWMFRFKVKLTGTVGIEVLETDLKRVVFRQKNRKKVQNHIGSVHAAGMALLAESATGFIVGANLPGDKLPLIKTMKLDYVKRATGDMQAEAWLTNEQIQQLIEQDKGEVTVNVKVTDAKGIEPVICEMIWAWIPKNKRV